MIKRAPLLRGIVIALLCLMVVLSIPDAAGRHLGSSFLQSATFLPRLHLGPLAYTQTTAMALAMAALLMMAAHTLLNFNKHMILQTVRAAVIIVVCLILTAGLTWGCCRLFRSIHGSITAMVSGSGLAVLSMTVLTARTAVRRTKITCRDLNRAFAYLHGLLAAAVTVVLPDASYLFTISALMLMAIQLLITFRRAAMNWGLELLATGLYLPVLMSVLVPAALAPGMEWCFGPLFALGIFPVGVWLAGSWISAE